VTSDIAIRPARLEDRDAVIALCAHIWEGEDYVPDVFDDWVADPRGEFTVAYDGPRLVALGKLTELAPDEWWLEGLRVHPDYRSRGFARRLHEHAVALADRTATGVLRFATSGSNLPVHALAARTGFALVSRYYHHVRADPHPIQVERQFHKVTVGELPDLSAWLAHSEGLAAAGGLYEERWSWLALAPQLEVLVRAERVAWWQCNDEERAGLVIFSHGQVDGETRLWVNYAEASAGELARLWHHLRGFAAQYGAAKVRAKPLATANTAVALAKAGWKVETDHTLWVYARPLPLPGRA
jgi:GNAT superfamily N-acetyltransferase